MALLTVITIPSVLLGVSSSPRARCLNDARVEYKLHAVQCDVDEGHRVCIGDARQTYRAAKATCPDR
jgi:hypothetical protein